MNLNVSSRKIHISEIYLSDEIYLTGTAAHITSVGSLDNRKIGNNDVGPITKELQSIYFRAVRGNNDKYQKWCTEVSI